VARIGRISTFSNKPYRPGSQQARTLRRISLRPTHASDRLIMRLPITITYHGIHSSEWIEHEIRRRAAKLDRYCPRLISCRVVVDIPHRHHEVGNRFNLRIDLTVPGEEIAVTRGSNLHAASQDLEAQEWVKQFDIEGMRKHLRVVIREAFDVARRRLQDYTRKHRRPVRLHKRRAQPGADTGAGQPNRVAS
jgi:ribosome-associated translation inhibitor RaiA